MSTIPSLIALGIVLLIFVGIPVVLIAVVLIRRARNDTGFSQNHRGPPSIARTLLRLGDT